MAVLVSSLKCYGSSHTSAGLYSPWLWHPVVGTDGDNTAGAGASFTWNPWEIPSLYDMMMKYMINYTIILADLFIIG